MSAPCTRTCSLRGPELLGGDLREHGARALAELGRADETSTEPSASSRTDARETGCAPAASRPTETPRPTYGRFGSPQPTAGRRLLDVADEVGVERLAVPSGRTSSPGRHRLRRRSSSGSSPRGARARRSAARRSTAGGSRRRRGRSRTAACCSRRRRRRRGGLEAVRARARRRRRSRSRAGRCRRRRRCRTRSATSRAEQRPVGVMRPCASAAHAVAARGHHRLARPRLTIRTGRRALRASATVSGSIFVYDFEPKPPPR